jgi:hypothetical protein
MLNKLALTDKRVGIICYWAQFGGLATIFVAFGVMLNSNSILPRPAWAVGLGLIAYGLAYWISTGVEERVTKNADYANGYATAQREIIGRGWRQEPAQEQIESVLPAELDEDLDAMSANIEEGWRFFQAALEHNTAMRRTVAGVNLYTSQLKAELAEAQARAAKAEGALDEIRGGLERYAYAPARKAVPAETAPAVPATSREAGLAIVAQTVAPEIDVASRPGAEILISPADRGDPPPPFIAEEPRAYEVDQRKTEDALMRLAGLAERRWPIAKPARAAGAT